MPNIEPFTNCEANSKSPPEEPCANNRPAKKHGKRHFRHQWISVVNPSNHFMLLQACDNCGVVKSENSVIRRCSMPQGQRLISGAMSNQLQETA